MSTKQTVLFVLSDEQQAALQSLLERLDRPDLTLRFLGDAAQALDQVGELDPCLVIVSQQLEEMTGSDFQDRFTKAYPGRARPLVVRSDGLTPRLTAEDEIALEQVVALLPNPLRSPTGPTTAYVGPPLKIEKKQERSPEKRHGPPRGGIAMVVFVVLASLAALYFFMWR